MAAFNFPNSPSTNDVYTANGVSFKWNGTIWQRISSSTGAQGATGSGGPTGAQGAAAGLTISTSAPGSPSAGDMWWDSDSGLFLTYYNDGNSSQWVELNQGPIGAQGAQGHQGATGPTGAQGATAAQGAQGATGATGAQGATGSTGPTGAQGATGSTGAQGALATINDNTNNYVVTATGTANTLQGEADLTFEKVNGVDPTFTFKRSSAASGNDNIYTELRFQNTSGTNMGQIICRRESSTDNAYLDFETKMDGQNSQPSMRIAGQTGTAYFVGNLGRTNNNQPAYFSNTIYGGSTIPSAVTIKTLTNGGECGLLIRGTSQGGGSSAEHACIRVDATACGNNADQYGIYLKGRQQLVSDTTGYYADVYGSYSTTYCFRGHLQKQVGAYTTGTTFHSKITQTSSGGASYHFRGYQDGTQRIRIELDGDIDNSNNSYGSLSDVKLKENIVDANSQWNDIKALKVRNFNFKDDPDKVKMIGLVAQEAESVSAGLVKTDDDIEIDESTGEGKVTGQTKYLKYSILYMKAIKALQEAQIRIETLESKVAALEGS